MKVAPADRAPVHVVYGGAHLFRYDTPQKLGRLALKALDTYAPSPADLAAVMGYDRNANFAEKLFARTREKLEREAVEDFRIDFEDGYGKHTDAEEDDHAVSAAGELARAFRDRTNSPFNGIRIKSVSSATRKRAIRTLRLFVTTLAKEAAAESLTDLSITLPKVTGVKEVGRLAEYLSKLERENNLKNGSLRIELMFESPAAFVEADGKLMPAKLVKAARGRCDSAHFGAYDHTAALGISAKGQRLRHPACDIARQIMLLTLAPLGVRLSDSVTTAIPAPLHRGENLTNDQHQQNRDAVHSAWRVHFQNVLYSMSNGFFQSWDLHPNQLVARFAAVTYYYLDGFDENAARLKRFIIENSQRATLTGNVFDDAASARGVVNFFLRGLNCGALNEDEIKTATGLIGADLRSLF